MVNSSKRSEPELVEEKPTLRFYTFDKNDKRTSFFECTGAMKDIPEVADFVTRHPGIRKVTINVMM
jgi:hypothetical protein